MSGFRVEFLPRAARDYKHLPAAVQARVATALESLAEDPLAGKPLQGPYAGLRSLRIGEYRLVYRPALSNKVVLVQAIGHRRDIYR